MRFISKETIGLLMENSNKYGSIYRGIMELMSRFDHLSSQEVMYGFNLDLQSSWDRFKYLVRANLIERFPSRTIPSSFFSLTFAGRQIVKSL